MIVRYNVLTYLIGEGFRNFFKNKKSTGASLMIMCATMLIFGLFFLIGQNVNYMLKEIESEQGMQVYINKDAKTNQIETLLHNKELLSFFDYIEILIYENNKLNRITNINLHKELNDNNIKTKKLK